MTFGENGDEKEFDDFLFADDDFLDVLCDFVAKVEHGLHFCLLGGLFCSP